MGVLQTPALTSWLHRHLVHWSGRRDSNPRPLPWQGSILPLNYFRFKQILPSFAHPRKLVVVPRGRFELPRAFAHHPLKMACLPIPPPRLGNSNKSVSPASFSPTSPGKSGTEAVIPVFAARWQGWQDSNPRPAVLETAALAKLSYTPAVNAYMPTLCRLLASAPPHTALWYITSSILMPDA